MTEKLIAATQEASAKWKASFNSGNAAGCAAAYERDALMVAKPFGEFRGTEAIQGFWLNLVDQGFAEVDYIEPEMTIVDEKTVLLTSGWKMNKAKGIITKELWVQQEDGSMLLREDHFEVQG